MLPQPSRALALALEIHGGDHPWHGYSTRRILDGITADGASRSPGGGAHSIWEIVLHMTSWTREVTSRLRGKEPSDPVDGDWPAMGEPTAARWQAAKAALDAAQDDLAGAVRAVPENQWDEPIGRPDPALGTGKTHLETLEGLAVHHAYHGGQIAILKRWLS